MLNFLKFIPGVDGLVKTVFGDKEARDRQGHTVDMAIHNQHANEFGHAKTWWDSLIDGINRLPRPAMTFGIIYIFYYCINDPEGFKTAMTALSQMPKEGWYLMGIIMTFWFGSKLPSDFGKLKRIRSAPARQITPKEHTSNITADIKPTKRGKKRYSNYDNLNT